MLPPETRLFSVDDHIHEHPKIFALEFSPPSAPTRDVSVGRSMQTAVGAVSQHGQQRA